MYHTYSILFFSLPPLICCVAFANATSSQFDDLHSDAASSVCREVVVVVGFERGITLLESAYFWSQFFCCCCLCLCWPSLDLGPIICEPVAFVTCSLGFASPSLSLSFTLSRIYTHKCRDLLFFLLPVAFYTIYTQSHVQKYGYVRNHDICHDIKRMKTVICAFSFVFLSSP